MCRACAVLAPGIWQKMINFSLGVSQVIGHNLLAEHWHIVRDADPGRKMFADASFSEAGIRPPTAPHAER